MKLCVYGKNFTWAVHACEKDEPAENPGCWAPLKMTQRLVQGWPAVPLHCRCQTSTPLLRRPAMLCERDRLCLDMRFAPRVLGKERKAVLRTRHVTRALSTPDSELAGKQLVLAAPCCCTTPSGADPSRPLLNRRLQPGHACRILNTQYILIRCLG